MGFGGGGGGLTPALSRRERELRRAFTREGKWPRFFRVIRTPDRSGITDDFPVPQVPCS